MESTKQITTLLFDLDGVLVDTEKIHYDSLTQAIRETIGDDCSYSIKQDGTSTYSKLLGLQQQLHLSQSTIHQIDTRKQALTLSRLNTISVDFDLIRFMESCREFNLGLVSNSRHENVDFILQKLKLSMFRRIVTPVSHMLDPKPSPAMYIHTMQAFHASPHNTVIFEDSPAGILAARRSGAYVFEVTDMNFIYRNIYDLIQEADYRCSDGG